MPRHGVYLTPPGVVDTVTLQNTNGSHAKLAPQELLHGVRASPTQSRDRRPRPPRGPCVVHDARHGAEYVVDFLPKVKIELVVSDDVADDAIAAITNAAKTGKIGDGKIFVSSIEQAIRIRTGEDGTDAL